MSSQGSKAQVWHGTAKRTSGGLTKNALMKNKHGHIVSRKQHKRGKQTIKHLFKLGYKPKKGTFTAFHKGSNKMKGGGWNHKYTIGDKDKLKHEKDNVDKKYEYRQITDGDILTNGNWRVMEWSDTKSDLGPDPKLDYNSYRLGRGTQNERKTKGRK